MSRDYKSRKPSKSKKSNGTLIFGILTGYALGVMSAIAVWLYLDQAPSPFVPEKTAHLDVNQQALKQQEEALAFEKEQEKMKKAEEEPQFDFYKILPGIEGPETKQATAKVVEQPMLPSIPKPTPTPTPHFSEITQKNEEKPTDVRSHEKYFLQAGSFKETADAENLRARLALLGIVSSVQTADLSEKGIWHRVRVGPFTQRSEVDKVQSSLQANGIEIHFIKMRNDN